MTRGTKETGEKSYVSMEQKICEVCGVSYDSGAILIDKRLRNTLKHKTVTGLGLCEEHTELKDMGYVALVEVDEAKSGAGASTTRLRQSEAYRTGAYAHLHENAFKELFGKDPPPPMVCFVDRTLIGELQRMKAEAEKE